MRSRNEVTGKVHTSSGHSPNLRRRAQSTVTPQSRNKQNAALKPFSLDVPHESPLLTQRRSQAFDHAGVLARRAIERTRPKAPVDAVENRNAACCVLAKGSRVPSDDRTMPAETNTTRVRSEGCIIIENASENKALFRDVNRCRSRG